MAAKTQSELLERALELAVEAKAAGNHPFGALLAVDGQIVAEAQNLVHTTHDITAHAELALVRQLERDGKLGLLSRGVVYASCEPCPMCVGAFFWAGARDVVFGLSHSRLNGLANAPGAEMFGFLISAADIGGAASPPMRFTGPLQEDRAAEPHVGFWHKG
eukprot:a684345_5.p1 GENE.a684345_5~~a684345_5.p1  ORF type:complete len:170 (-),score=71.75 a684345_5:65-547(-)